ncbi:hypothetical protein AHAS_Ahas20G0140900 [Arachis hypogaea]
MIASLSAVASAIRLDLALKLDADPVMIILMLSLIIAAEAAFPVSLQKDASTFIFSQSFGGGLQVYKVGMDWRKWKKSMQSEGDKKKQRR